MRDLSVEIIELIGEIHPTAFTGDLPALAMATGGAADVLGGLFALIRKEAPSEAMAQAAIAKMIDRALRFADVVQVDADSQFAQCVQAPERQQ